MKNATFVKITNVSEVKEDKNDVNYKTFRAKENNHIMMFDPAAGKEVSVLNPAARETGVNQWEKSYDSSLKGQSDPFYDAKIGDRLAGAIVTRSCPEYGIVDEESGEERTVDSYTTVVFGDTSDEQAFEIAILKAFKRNSHDLAGLPQEQIILDAVEEEATEEYLEETEEEPADAEA